MRTAGFPGGAVVKNHLPRQKMQERWVRSMVWEYPLKEKMATHSHIHAWRIPWIEDPSRLQSMGSERVGHN